MIDKLEKETFSQHLGDYYHLHRDDLEPMALELIEVTCLGSGAGKGTARRGGGPPFSVVFRGPPDTCLEQRIYRLEHEQMGAVDLFLVPIGKDEQGFCYEAIFN